MKLIPVLTVLFLIAFISGCARTTVLVDPYMARDCQQAPLMGNTYRDVVEAYINARESIDECNARLKVIRGE